MFPWIPYKSFPLRFLKPYISTKDYSSLTHRDLNKMADFLEKTFSNTFSWTNISVSLSLNFCFFHWGLFAWVQIIISQHWLRWWLGARQATSHYLYQCWPVSLIHIFITWTPCESQPQSSAEELPSNTLYHQPQLVLWGAWIVQENLSINIDIYRNIVWKQHY